jgi:hypothetical protein
VVFGRAQEVPLGWLSGPWSRRVSPASLAADAVVAGWRVVATTALAGIVEVSTEPIEQDHERKARSGERRTRDVLTPVVRESVALRMWHPDGRRAVAVFGADGLQDGYTWVPGMSWPRRTLVKALKAYLVADAGTVSG